MQIQMDSSPIRASDIPGIERKDIVFHCPKHGEMTLTLTKLYHWSSPSCPACKADEEREQVAVEERRRVAAKQAAIESRLRASGIPFRFKDKDFAAYRPTEAKARKALDVCQNYAANFPSFAAKGTSLMLCGFVGTGKTHLGCAIANQIITQHGKSAVYLHVSSAFRMVKETYGKTSKQTEQQAIDWFTVPDLLILDEIGVQHGTDTERNILFEIINMRYERMKPTIFLANLNITSLIEYAGERTIDRMKENGGMMLVFDWGSYRGG